MFYMEKNTKVLYCTAECSPFSKAGGVASVAGELPPELKKQGIDIEILTPYYGPIEEKHNLEKGKAYEIEFNGKQEQIQLYRGNLDNVPVTFVKNETHFRTKQVHIRSNIPYEDDARRFSFLSEACLPIIKSKNPDIVHVNDWQFGYLLGLMKINGLKARTVTTIHNLGYQGNMWQPKAEEISSTIRKLTTNPLTSRLFQDPRQDWHSVNPFRLALELSDKVNAVSPNYAREILEPEDQSRYFEGGKGLESITRRLHEQGKLVGILNGYNYNSEPTSENFEAIISKKKQVKEQMSFAFTNPENLLFGFVGRAVEQKLKLLKENLNGKSVLEHLLEIPGINFAFLGTGESEYERFLNNYSQGINSSAIITFDSKRANIINLGSDICLMPSTYEPCGITQLEAMDRATPPLVRWTGGLVDTVIDYSSPNGTGFGFNGNSRDEVLRGLVNSVLEAKKLYDENKERFKELRLNSFRSRFTWTDSAKKYINEVYEPLMRICPDHNHCRGYNPNNISCNDGGQCVAIQDSPNY